MAENRYKQAKKVFSISLGAGCRGFKSLHSDQKGSKAGAFEPFYYAFGFLPGAGRRSGLTLVHRPHQTDLKYFVLSSAA